MGRFRQLLCLVLPLAWAVADAQAGGAAWRQLDSLADLPLALRASLQASEGLSDRGGPFNAGCVRTDATPSSRFVMGAASPGVVVVAVERGGFAHFVETLEFRQAGSDWRLAARGNGPLAPADAAALLARHRQSVQPL